jgi:peroxiredoxin
MQEKLLSPGGRTQDRSCKLHRIGLAFLLLLSAAGLGLLARTAIQDLGSKERSEGRALPCLFPPPSSLGAPIASPSRSLQEILSQRDIIPTHHHPLLGRQAPDFALADADGKFCNLKELQDGRPVVLIFYYGYHCVACVRQLFEINRDLPLFREVGTPVVAISADPPELTRLQFQEYGSFSFPVLSDPGNKVAHAYRASRALPDGAAHLRHGTFIIDGHGTVRWVNVGDAPFRRDPALLYQLAKIRGAVP